MGFLSTAVGWFLGLGSSLIVMIVLIILGLVFRVGWQKAVRGGITTGVGLAGLFLVVNVIISALQPAVAEMATRFGMEKTLVDVNWADAGIAWGWPGVAGLIVSILVVNILMLVLKLTKTLWTDVWSYWHGSALAGFVWALTGGNVFLGILAGVLYLVAGSLMSDLTAKKYQEFNDMPGIGVPCGTTVQASSVCDAGCLAFGPHPWTSRIGMHPPKASRNASVWWVSPASWVSCWVSSSVSSPMAPERAIWALPRSLVWA